MLTSKREIPIYIEALVENKKKFKFMKKRNIQVRPLPPNLSM